MDDPVVAVEFPILPVSPHYLLWNLARRPRVRDLCLRESAVGDFLAQHDDEISACYVQVSGDVADSPCSACAKGTGMFVDCVTIPQYLGGSCASCLYSGPSGRVCSLSATGLARQPLFTRPEDAHAPVDPVFPADNFALPYDPYTPPQADLALRRIYEETHSMPDDHLRGLMMQKASLLRSMSAASLRRIELALDKVASYRENIRSGFPMSFVQMNDMGRSLHGIRDTMDQLHLEASCAKHVAWMIKRRDDEQGPAVTAVMPQMQRGLVLGQNHIHLVSRTPWE